MRSGQRGHGQGWKPLVLIHCAYREQCEQKQDGQLFDHQRKQENASDKMNVKAEHDVKNDGEGVHPRGTTVLAKGS